jgi:hypothetical protein
MRKTRANTARQGWNEGGAGQTASFAHHAFHYIQWYSILDVATTLGHHSTNNSGIGRAQASPEQVKKMRQTVANVSHGI